MTTQINRAVGSKRTADQQELDDLRDYFDNGAIGLHWVGGDGTILRANRADYELLGYSADEYIGRHIAEFHADPDVIDDILSRLTRGETLKNYEARLRAKDGSIRHVLIDSNVLERDGEFVHTRCFTRDHTATVRAQEILREHDADIVRFTDALPALAWLADASGAATHFNQHWVEYTGMSNEASLAGAWTDAVHPDDRRDTDATWQPARASGQELLVEHRLRRHDGVYRWHESRLLPIRGESGIVASWFATSTDVQDRRDATDAQELSDARYRSIAESMPALVTLSNADGTLEFCNQRLLDYTGLTQEQAASNWRRTLFHPEDFTANIAEWRRALASGETIESEYRARRADGVFRWHLARIVPIRTEDGTVRMWVGAHIDIHDRKTAEDALQSSEERYRSIAESMPAMVTLSSADGTMEFCNKRLLDYMGLTFEAAVGGAWQSIFHPDDYAANIEEWTRGLTAGEAIESEYRARRHDGVYRWHLGRVMPVHAEDGSVRMWVGAHIDIHDRKEAEDALQVSQRRVQSLTESPVIGVISGDAERIHEANDAFLRMSGYTREDIDTGDLSWRAITPPDWFEADAEHFAELLERGVVSPYEKEYFRKNGTRVPMIIGGAVVSYEPLEWIYFTIDLTERKRVEAERETLIDELRVANAAKDEFLGLVSHELKTPITTILGNAMVLRLRADKIDAESRDTALRDMSTEAERLHYIIDNLLVLARLERGQEIVAEPLLISRIVEKLVGEHKHHFPLREIRVQAEERMAPAGGEPVYVEQVLRNLLSNAEKYSPSDNLIDVVIRQEKGELLVSVIDGGAGFSDEEIEQVFAPFYRSPRIAATIGGVGIGLSVCKRLIEAQGGRVWARRTTDGGAEVGFSLPMVDDDA